MKRTPGMEQSYILYRHYNESGELLYVGISTRVMRRTREHEKYSPWFQESVRMLMERFADEVSLLEAEKAAIKNECPKYNIIYNSDRSNEAFEITSPVIYCSGPVVITKRTVDEAKPREDAYIIWDHTVKGFGLRVNPTGKKVYIYRYRLKVPGRAARTISPRQMTIGPGTVLTPKQARSRAAEMARLVTQEIDPHKTELALRRSARLQTGVQ